MKQRVGWSIGLLVVAGCGGGPTSPSENVSTRGWGLSASWTLFADDEGALVDDRNPELRYPNPLALSRLDISISDGGEICGSSNGETWCGGALQGLPYRATGQVDGRSRCGTVTDIYGHLILRNCASVTADDSANGDANGADGTDVVDEGPTTESGGDENGSDGTNTDGSDQNESAGEDSGSDTNGSDGSSSGDSNTEGGGTPADQGATCGNESVRTGAVLLTSVLNSYFAKIGLDYTVAEPSSSWTAAGHHFASNAVAAVPSGFNLNASSCELLLEGLDKLDNMFTDAFSAELVKECVEEGRCRIGQLMVRAMGEACKQLPAEDCDVDGASLGIEARAGELLGELCDFGTQVGQDASTPDDDPVVECIGSPLVLDLAGDGLQLKGPEAGTRFQLLFGAPMHTGWIQGTDDALLALDIDGDGAIRSGAELFGEATGGWSPDGFSALRRHDANRDGKIDHDDPMFDRLLAWKDNGDGVSQPSELLPLDSLGVVEIQLAASRVDRIDAFGNLLGLESSAELATGKRVGVIDVWFRFGR